MQNISNGQTESTGRESQVTSALSKLSKAIERAEKATSSLSNRIERIITPIPPSIAEVPGKKPESQVQLAVTILEMFEHVQQLTDFIETLERRIEL